MKKIFAILMTICLMVGALSITAFAAEELPAPAEGVVMRVTILKNNGVQVPVENGDYTDFETGWEAAIDLAEANTKGYDRIAIHFFADWTANEDGEFGDTWDGFSHGAILIPDDVKLTIYLNGHTINRNLTESESNGEVMYIDEDADVVISNGTITGGKSTNGAGGIHIHDADVMLSNVHIVGNVADGDDGGGIALYDGATLTMNGGSFENNVIVGSSWNGAFQCYGGAVYVEDSKATFGDVEFKNNQTENDEDYGAAIYADDSEVYVKNCTFDGNGIKDDSKNFKTSCSIIHGDDSTINIENVTFTNNGGGYYYDERYAYNGARLLGFYSSIFTLEDTKLYISGESKFSNNNVCYIFFCRQDAGVYVSDTTFVDNTSMIIFSNEWNENDNYFKNCTFNNNKMTSDELGHFVNYQGETFNIDVFANFAAIRITFTNCDMGDSKFFQSDLEYLSFVDCENAPDASARRFGSIFGEGSLTMIVALLALIASGVSIFLTVYYNKKKAVPAAANNATEEGEE